MNNLIAIAIIAAFSGLMYLIFPNLPWYTPLIICVIAGAASSKLKVHAFLSGFFGVTLFWLLLTLIANAMNGGIMAQRMAALFTEQMGLRITAPLLLIVTPLLGGLMGGWMMWCGKHISIPIQSGNYVRKKKNNKGSYTLKLN